MTPQRPHCPSQSPPAVDASAREGQPTLEALQALVAEKSRLLMQREQDVQFLLRRVQDTNRWAELSAVTAAKIAPCVSAESAVEAFAHALAADFGFEYAVVVWRGYSVEAPPLPSTRCRERANAVMDDSAASPYGFATVADVIDMLKGRATQKGLVVTLVQRSPIPEQILLVEDTLVSRVLVERFLTKSGFEVTTAVDGLDALEVVRRADVDGRTFDVILLDMQMPNLDGYGCARQLRDDGVTIPIVALTAHAMTGDRERCYEAGCSDYLTKPVERAILVEKVQHLILATCTTVQTGGDMQNSERGHGFAAELST